MSYIPSQLLNHIHYWNKQVQLLKFFQFPVTNVIRNYNLFNVVLKVISSALIIYNGKQNKYISFCGIDIQVQMEVSCHLLYSAWRAFETLVLFNSLVTAQVQMLYGTQYFTTEFTPMFFISLSLWGSIFA